MEQEIESQLERMKQEGKYIALSLHPAFGKSTITREGNRMMVNEGRDGKYEEVSESFYDSMVVKYDSRA